MKETPKPYTQPRNEPFVSTAHSNGLSLEAPTQQDVFIQAKLQIGAPGDAYEKQADRMADYVIQRTHSGDRKQGLVQRQQNTPSALPGSAIQPKCEKCEQEEPLRRKEMPGISSVSSGLSGGMAAPDHISRPLESASGGRPLPRGTRAEMEGVFGADLGGVRIHENAKAVQMSRELNAQAFTVGHDIYFNEGKYDPSSKSGKHLLAHELTHTLQQGGISRKIQKYSHEDCDEKLDLRPHIWLADPLAKKMVTKAITELSKATMPAWVNTLLDKHFNSHSASTVASVLEVFEDIKAAFDEDDYTYECEDDCDGANAYVYSFWSDVHLCMNNLRGKNNKGIAAIIVHEFSHYYGGTDDEQYYFSFGVGSAPASLSVSDAIDNADSYEGFAYDV